MLLCYIPRRDLRRLPLDASRLDRASPAGYIAGVTHKAGGTMESQQEWHEEDRHQPVPMFAPYEVEAGGVAYHNQGPMTSLGKSAPRALQYGNSSRFGMVKGSIAARRANAAAASAASAAAKAQSPRAEQTAASSSASKTSLLAARATTTAVATAGASNQHEAGRTNQLGSNRIEAATAEEDCDPSSLRQTPPGSNLEQNVQGDENDDGWDSSALLGPMGSFYELSNVSSAADLIRTAAHDKSSHSVSQARGLRQANIPTAYSEVASTGYYRPSDRIGRLYTSTAAALTSASAQSVAKAAATLAVSSGAPGGVGGGGAAGGGGGNGSASNRARNNGVGAKLVTAPFAAESREILQTLARQPASSRPKLAAGVVPVGNESPSTVASAEQLAGGAGGSGNQSPSPTGAGAPLEGFDRSPGGGSGHGRGLESPGSPGRQKKKKKAIVIESAQDTRTQLRERRSPLRGRRVLEVAPSSGGVDPASGGVAASSCGGAAVASDEGGGYAVRDFRSWNPAVLDGPDGGGADGRGGHGQRGGALDDRGGNGASVGCGTGDKSGGNVKTMSEAEKQKESIDHYWEAVEDRMLRGSPNALGAGAKSPLFELPPERIDGVTSRLAFELRLIPGIELGAYQAYVEATVNSMLQDVQVAHSVSVARAVVDYELRDPERRRALGVERGHLTAGPRWYQSQEYLIPEWRVLRRTGVSRARVRRAALALKRRLCSVETVMVGLEKLWHSGVVPGDWDTAAFGGSGDVVSFALGAAGISPSADRRRQPRAYTYGFCS